VIALGEVRLELEEGGDLGGVHAAVGDALEPSLPGPQRSMLLWRL